MYIVVRHPAKGTAEHLGDTAIREIRHHMETDEIRARHLGTTRGQRQITEKNRTNTWRHKRFSWTIYHMFHSEMQGLLSICLSNLDYNVKQHNPNQSDTQKRKKFKLRLWHNFCIDGPTERLLCKHAGQVIDSCGCSFRKSNWPLQLHGKDQSNHESLVLHWCQQHWKDTDCEMSMWCNTCPEYFANRLIFFKWATRSIKKWLTIMNKQ